MTTYNTGNPLGSTDPRDLYDNAENLDHAVNSDGDTFQDRLGKSRLTWAGIEKAGSGDPAIAVDAAARAEAAASQVQQNASQIAHDAAQQAVQDVMDAVDGQVAVAQSAADRAETAADSVKPYVDGALSDLSTAANKFYPTLAAANADIANIEVNQPVHVGEAVNGGLWYKATSGSTTLTKSAYDPLVAAKAYTADYVSKTGFAKIAGNAQTNINYDTATRTLTFSNTVYITTGTTRVQLTTPQSVVLASNAMHRLEYIVSTGLIRAHEYTQNYIEGYIPFALVRAYPDKIKTTDFQYAINGVEYDAVKIAAIDATNKVKALEDKIISQGSNLYDASAATIGKLILDDGSIVDDAIHSITEFIDVLPSQQYTIKAASDGTPVRGFNYICYYDANKNFISRAGFSNTGTGSDDGALTVTMPSDAYYIRLNMQDTLPATKSRQINLGAVALPYESYKPTELKVDLSQENIDQVLAQATDTAKPYIAQSSNLYDASAATVGYTILSDGTVSANETYCHSDFIKVEPNQKYTAKAWSQLNNARIRGFNAIAYYDVNKNFISRIGYDDTAVSADGVGVFTTLENAAYIRLNMQDTDPARYNRQVNKGVDDIPFEPYRVQLSGIALASDIMQQIGSELQIEKSDNIMLDLPVDGVFNTDQVWDMYTGWRGGATKANDVYAMFDALQVQHPAYITKQYLGDDLFGNSISAYKFIPSKPNASVDTKYPKAFITCGTHGYEHVPPLAMYLLLEQICNNWRSDPLLEALRFNLDLIIIPVVNPSGFDDYTRKNRNGVDINRNFPEGFGWQATDPESPYYGGPEPLSELEAQYISQVMDENPDIDMCYDFHNFHGTSVETHPHYIWVPTGSTPYVQHMAQMLVSRMTRKWQTEFSWLPQDHEYHAGYSNGTTGAMVQDHARARGIAFSATFEVCEKWWLGNGIVSTYDETHCKTAVEAIANWLLINLNELKRM